MDRRQLVIALALMVAVVAIGFGALPGQTQETVSASPNTSSPYASEVIEPVPNGSTLWPYTSKTRSVEGRTLGMNLIVVGDRSTVQSYFRRHAEGNWTRRPHPAEPKDGGDAVLPIEDTGPVWEEGYASTRYTHIIPADSGEGIWVDEAYELFDGTYLGSRYHTRAYVPPAEENWTALQVHREYWDWFRLRHTVTSVATAQRYVEADLRANAPIEPMSMRYLTAPGPLDSSGWVTIVEFVAILALLGALRVPGIPARRLQSRFVKHWSKMPGKHPDRMIPVLVGIPAIYMGVRIGAIALESAMAGTTPKVIVAALYPVLALGLPYVADRFSRPVRPENAFLHATVGLAIAFFLEFTYLGLEIIPVGLLLHRVSLALALGLLGAGAALSVDGDRWNIVRTLGLVGWLLGLVAGLIGIG